MNSRTLQIIVIHLAKLVKQNKLTIDTAQFITNELSTLYCNYVPTGELDYLPNLLNKYLEKWKNKDKQQEQN